MRTYHISPFEDYLGKPWYWGSGGTDEQPKKTKSVSPRLEYQCECGKRYGAKQGLNVHKWQTKHL